MKNLALLAISLVLGCVVVRTGEAPIIPMNIFPLSGQTICAVNNIPVILIEPRVWEGRDREHTIVHEKVHVRQILRFGDCFKFMRKYSSDKVFRVRMEREAYCEQSAFVEATGEDPQKIEALVALIFKNVLDTTGVTC